MSTPNARLAMVTIDCTDPQAEAAFWSALLGWTTTYADENYAMLSGPDHALGFGRSEDYQPPAWPNEHGSKHFHLDLAVADIDATADRCRELGGTIPDFQPGETWRVVLDPAGHPFCLTDATRW